MIDVVVVDLDGTIADCTHRLHFIQGTNKDWDAFYNACKDDAPIESMVKMVHALNERFYHLVFLTGRSEIARSSTDEWLLENKLWSYDALLMRPLGDYRDDSVVKLELLNNYVNNEMGADKTITFILEDRNTVVKAYREAGYKVLQVAEGNF